MICDLSGFKKVIGVRSKTFKFSGSFFFDKLPERLNKVEQVNLDLPSKNVFSNVFCYHFKLLAWSSTFWITIMTNSRPGAITISRHFVRTRKKVKSSEGSRLRTALRASWHNGPMNFINSVVWSSSNVELIAKPKEMNKRIDFLVGSSSYHLC